MKLILLAFLSFAFTGIYQEQTIKSVNSEKVRLLDRFTAPSGYKTIKSDSGTFQFYLQNLKLKTWDARVKYFDGTFKDKAQVYCSVVDMEIGNKDLQQCADAVMRLRAEYLYSIKNYNAISFRFNDGKMHPYTTYAGTDRTYGKFLKYMDYIFSYANTASLKKQLKPVAFYKMQVGDVFIQSGNPYGHAVIVVNQCNAKGEKQFMLAQSYMPAQETQILLNYEGSSAWYSKPASLKLQTPEWTFDTTDLRRF